MAKEKHFTVTYRAEVKKLGYVTAKNEAEARKKFDKGDFQEGYDLDLLDIDDICIHEDEE